MYNIRIHLFHLFEMYVTQCYHGLISYQMWHFSCHLCMMYLGRSTLRCIQIPTEMNIIRVVYSNINKCICMCAWFLTYDQDAWLSTIGGVFSPKWDSKKPHSNIRNIETLFFISIFKGRNVFFSSSSILQRALAYWHILNLQIFYLSWGDKHDRHERSIVYDFKAREYSGIMSLHITRTRRGLA